MRLDLVDDLVDLGPRGITILAVLPGPLGRFLAHTDYLGAVSTRLPVERLPELLFPELSYMLGHLRTRIKTPSRILKMQEGPYLVTGIGKNHFYFFAVGTLLLVLCLATLVAFVLHVKYDPDAVAVVFIVQQVTRRFRAFDSPIHNGARRSLTTRRPNDPHRNHTFDFALQSVEVRWSGNARLSRP